MLEIDTEMSGILPYQELVDQVWHKNLCSGCRGCIAVCLADTLGYDQKHSRPYQVNPCVECKACLDACPRLSANAGKIDSSKILGNYLEIKNVRSKAGNVHFQIGGAVTALLAAALEEELVDCALIMGLDHWTHRTYPRIVYQVKDLARSAGSKYTSNAVLESMKDLVKEPSIKNVAVVGTACTVQAVGLLRRSQNEYAMKLAQKVRFLLGLFCFEAFDESLISEIARRIDVPSWRIDKISAGEGQMTVTLRDRSMRSIPLLELAGNVRPGCRTCADFTAILSDISVGGVGSAPGMSSVIIRTPEGLGLFKIAEEMGFLEAWDGVKAEAIERVGKRKLERYDI
jgi:coenzyme F420 hydrogenase subunit beta